MQCNLCIRQSVMEFEISLVPKKLTKHAARPEQQSNNQTLAYQTLAPRTLFSESPYTVLQGSDFVHGRSAFSFPQHEY
jgi:hypothetical protein